MHISPIINNKITADKINCKNYTSFTSKGFLFFHPKEDIVEERLSALNRANKIKKAALNEKRKAEAIIDFDCYSGFLKEYGKKGTILKEYVDSKIEDELLLKLYHKCCNRTIAFDVVSLDVKSVEIDFKKSKSKTTYYFDKETLLLKKAVLGQKRTLSGTIKASEVLIFNDNGHLEKYYKDAILSPQKGKIQKAKEAIDFSI